MVISRNRNETAKTAVVIKLDSVEVTVPGLVSDCFAIGFLAVGSLLWLSDAETGDGNGCGDSKAEIVFPKRDDLGTREQSAG